VPAQRSSISALRAVVAVSASVVALVATGIPTSMIANPWFTRMTPIAWWGRSVWIVSAVLVGILASTFVIDRRDAASVRKAAGGGVLTALAVGCPTCNKLVVMALGVSGALSYWSPLQPLLAALSIGLMVFAIIRRTRQVPTCPIVHFETDSSTASDRV